jgi:hypothetical protein
MDPRFFVLNFRKEFYGVNEDGTQAEVFKNISKNLSNAIEQLSKGLYEKDVHFILELIQNAEDNEYLEVSPELRFLLIDHDPTNTPGSDGCLCVFNNESGFSEANIKSVSQIGGSTKSKKFGYIGEKGIGFKSVFVVSDRPHVFSNGYQIFFRETDPSIDLSYIVPYWAEDVPAIVSSNAFTTAILLPLKPGKREEIAEELLHFSPETILFLTKLESLSIHIDGRDSTLELMRDTSRQPTIDLLVHQNDSDVAVDQYWVYSETIPVPPDIREEKRLDVADRVVTLAFPLGDTDSQGTLFAFLPTEIASGLPFLVNADFLLTANRESIQVSRRWNKWLRDEVGAVAVRGLQSMLSDPAVGLQMYGYIPIPDDLKTSVAFLKPICEMACERLATLPVVLTVGGTYVLPNDARLVEDEFRGLFADSPELPSKFSEISFVQQSLEGHSKRLRAIGVNSIARKERLECLSDERWNGGQTVAWFVRLFRFLRDSKAFGPKEPFESLPIIPLDGGGLCRVGQSRVYLSSRNNTSSQGHQISEGLPQLQFLHPEVQYQLEEDPDLLNWFCKKFDATSFSVSNYVEGTLVPWLDTNAEELSERQLFEALTYVCAGWRDIEETAIDRICREMPVLLDTGDIVRREDLRGEQLLTPRELDKDRGWQVLLKQRSETAHHDVLSAKYLGLQPSGASLPQFLGAIGAEAFPRLVTLQEHVHLLRGRGFGRYYSDVYKAIPRNYTQAPSIVSWVPPDHFFNDGQRENYKNRRALLYWLEAAVEKYAEEIAEADLNWFYYTKQYRCLPSLLQYHLQRDPWVKTTHGIKPPTQAFRKTKQIREIFGDRLPYVEEKISAAVGEYLGVKTEATTETIVEFLRDLSGSDGVDSRTVLALYSYLARFGKHYQDVFAEEPLIYVPGEAAAWFISSEVVWKDYSNVLSGVYGYLEPVYGAHELRKFFVDSLGVSERVSAEELARAWLMLPERDDLEPGQMESALEVIVPGVASVLLDSDDDDLPGWWEDFADTVQVWTRDDTFESPERVYIADDRILERMFSDKLCFAWKPESRTYNDLASLFSALGLSPISTSIDVALADAVNPSRLDECRILTGFTKRLLVYFIYNDSPEAYLKHFESGALPAVLHAAEAVSSDLVLRYSVRGSDAVATEQRSAHWDESASILYTALESDGEDVLDEVAEALARFFWGRRYKVAEDTIRTLLQVTTEVRYRKIRDKKGWHLPLDEQKRVQEHIDAGATVVPNDEIQDEQEVLAAPGGGQREGTSSGAYIDGIGVRAPQTSPNGQDRPRQAGSKQTTARKSSAGARGTRPTSHTSEGQPSVPRRSRSSAVTNKANSIGQSRIPVYVSGQSEDRAGPADDDIGKDRQDIGDAAEEWVKERENALGMEACRMPPGNAGYDIESVDPTTGETKFIEVKGMGGSWGLRGVGLSAVQYRMALDKGDAYWLCIVEHARSDPAAHLIRDPARRVTEYRFDRSWLALAESSTGETPDAAESLEGVISELKTYTEDSGCREIIDLCIHAGVIFPEVGYEPVENDEVIGEVELAWPAERLAVAIDGQGEVHSALERRQWTVLSPEEIVDDWQHYAAILSAENSRSREAGH